VNWYVFSAISIPFFQIFKSLKLFILFIETYS
jgi:hypothetical protein